jgi:hypothetical protein
MKGQQDNQRLRDKSWRQELLGQWTEEWRLKPTFEGEIVIFRSAWNKGLNNRTRLRHAKEIDWRLLETGSHEEVVQNPELAKAWSTQIWDRIMSSSRS